MKKKDDFKKISIIIPAYNAEKSILYTLNSIRNQTYKNYEAIIIDDGSIDKTSIIAKDYVLSDSRFRYYYQENSGVAMARNKGLVLSEGEYICFLDSDDYYESNFLEKMYKKIKEENCDVCYCGYNMVGIDSTKSRKTCFKRGNILVEFILGRINIHTTGWMIKNDYLKRNNLIFPKGVSWGEDFEFFSEVLATTDKVCYVDEYLTNYRVGHNNNQLSNFSLDKIDKDYESIMRLINNERINNNKKIENALLNHRLRALIIYRLIQAIDRGFNKNKIQDYYKRYRKYINKWTMNNGLRSIKLNLNRITLFYKML